MDLALLTADPDPGQVLPALGLLAHEVRALPLQPASLTDLVEPAAVLVDARTDLACARGLCRLVAGSLALPVVGVFTEGGLVAVTPDWHVDEIVLPGAGPAEIDARLRLVAGRREAAAEDGGGTGLITLGDVTIDEETYVARVRGRPLDLTYKEFELLKYLCLHVGRVFTRAQLLQEVWGYDFFGGTRTVDVHVRRLRAKLGSDHESLIGTVRNVGYKAVPLADGADRDGRDDDGSGDEKSGEDG